MLYVKEVCVCVCMCMCMCVRACVCVCVSKLAYIFSHVCVFMHIYLCIYAVYQSMYVCVSGYVLREYRCLEAPLKHGPRQLRQV